MIKEALLKKSMDNVTAVLITLKELSEDKENMILNKSKESRHVINDAESFIQSSKRQWIDVKFVNQTKSQIHRKIDPLKINNGFHLGRQSKNNI